jgi:hypothetical protein
MSAALSAAFVVPDPAASPATRFTRIGRIGAAATLVLGATFQVLAFALAPNYSKTADRLQWIADNPTRAELSKLFDVLAMPFLVGGVVVYFLLSRARTPRLAWFGALVLGCGLVGLSMSQGYETLEFRLVTDGLVDLTTLAHTVDTISTAPEIAMGVLFLAGILIGILATIAALWRSRAVPRGAVVLMFVFVVLDVPLQRPLTAHVIALLAASWIAWSILSAPRREPAPS